jgi:hypothetical protein
MSRHALILTAVIFVGLVGGCAKKKAEPKKEEPAAKVEPEAKVQVDEGGKGGGDGEGGGGENDGERPPLTADTKIRVRWPGEEVVFTGDKLAKLPTSHAPIGDTDTPGWTLNQILDAVGVKPTGKVVVQGEESANLILEPGDLDPAKAVLFIKLNRSGQLRFRVFRKVGDTYEVAGELRGITEIGVL